MDEGEEAILRWTIDDGIGSIEVYDRVIMVGTVPDGPLRAEVCAEPLDKGTLLRMWYYRNVCFPSYEAISVNFLRMRCTAP